MTHSGHPHDRRLCAGPASAAWDKRCVNRRPQHPTKC